jgi:hypothetical protein
MNQISFFKTVQSNLYIRPSFVFISYFHVIIPFNHIRSAWWQGKITKFYMHTTLFTSYFFCHVTSLLIQNLSRTHTRQKPILSAYGAASTD